MRTKASYNVRPNIEAIQRLRQLKGWSQLSLANTAICSLRTIQNMEKEEGRDIRRMHWRTLSKIARALDVDINAIIHHDDIKPLTDELANHQSPEYSDGSPVTAEIKITLSMPFHEFDEGTLDEFVNKLLQFWNFNGEIDILPPGGQSSSHDTEVFFKLAKDDAFSLINALRTARKGVSAKKYYSSGRPSEDLHRPTERDLVSDHLGKHLSWIDSIEVSYSHEMHYLYNEKEYIRIKIDKNIFEYDPNLFYEPNWRDQSKED